MKLSWNLKKVSIGIIMGFFILSMASMAWAEGSGRLEDTIPTLNKRGKHVAAVAQFKKLDSTKQTLADKIAAAQSGWALGLVDFSRTLWNEILANPEFKGTERHRAVLALAILELQESHYDRARALAEKTLADLEKSDLRAQFLLVIGEALSEQGAHTKAESYYREAADVGNDVMKSEARYYLGENQLALGRLDAARKSFTEVETASDYAPRALYRLTKIDLDQNKWDGVLTWVKEGRNEFPLQFEDPWVRYAAVIALLESGQADNAEEELHAFKARYSDNDSWYVLANSAYEGKQVNQEIALLEKKIPAVIDEAREVPAADISTTSSEIKNTASPTKPLRAKVVSFKKSKGK